MCVCVLKSWVDFSCGEDSGLETSTTCKMWFESETYSGVEGQKWVSEKEMIDQRKGEKKK